MLDLEDGFGGCREHNAGAILDGRIRPIVGDARTFDSPEKYDLVMLNELLELFADDEKEQIATRACRAIKPGGHLLVTKFPLDVDGTGPTRFPIFSMRMHLKFPGSYLETDAEVRQLFERLGLRLTRTFDANRTALLLTNPNGV